MKNEHGFVLCSLKNNDCTHEVFPVISPASFFGRPSVSKRSLLERKLREADRLCLTQLHTLFEDVPPPWLVSYKSEEGANSRHRR